MIFPATLPAPEPTSEAPVQPTSAPSPPSVTVEQIPGAVSPMRMRRFEIGTIVLYAIAALLAIGFIKNIDRKAVAEMFTELLQVIGLCTVLYGALLLLDKRLTRRRERE